MKRKTNKEFLKEIEIVNPNIEILSEYVLAAQKVDCRCKICGHKWSATPNNLLSGRGCRVCKIKETSGAKSKSNDAFVADLKTVNVNIEPLEAYVRSSIKIKCKCKIDGYEWYATPNNLLRGKKCPRCMKAEKYTPEQFREKMKTINSNIDIIGDYKNSHQKIKCKCKKCGHEWYVVPNSLMNGTGCPICCSSKGEILIADTLSKLGINFEKEKSYDKLCGDYGWPLRYDFYIPSCNLLIEYQGKQHEIPFEYFGGNQYLSKRKRYDEYKRMYAKDNGIDLLEIWYWEYNNIPEIIEKIVSTKGG